jgi:pimeloyl-ACP methyl ester carboxylesterase
MPPTIILVLGASAESSSWDGVANRLTQEGHPVTTVADPLRSVASDAAAVADVVRTVDGPVVLVGHSFGGAIISNVSPDAGDITALAYIAGYAPDYGESAKTLAAKFHGSRPAATRRFVAPEALEEPTGERPLWKQVPAWFLIAGRDRNIPPELQRFMAERAGARGMLEIPTASHAVAVSHPEQTARLVLEAAAAPAVVR